MGRKSTSLRFRRSRTQWPTFLCAIIIAFVAGYALDRRYGHSCPEPTPSTRVQVYFSPKGGTKQAIMDHLAHAESEIVAALYSFTESGLAKSLLDAHERGITVNVALDGGQRNAQGGQGRRLIDAGISVVYEQNPGLMHHKFVVIDRRYVVTGSYNWSRNAERSNSENLLIVDDPTLAEQYLKEFERLIAKEK